MFGYRAEGNIMPVEMRFDQSDIAITVPYASFKKGRRENYGFVDIRGRPDLASKIAEGLKSPSLQKLLLLAASGGAPVFSVGCDLGSHLEADALESARFVAGGYVQFVSNQYALAPPAKLKGWAKSVAKTIKKHAMDANWRVLFEIAPIQLNIDDFFDLTGSIHVSFWALAQSPMAAADSRELLIQAITDGVRTSSFNRASDGAKDWGKSFHKSTR
jgi:hypothetical protein